MRNNRKRNVVIALALATAFAAGALSYFAYSPPDALEHSVEHYAPAASGGGSAQAQTGEEAGYGGPMPDYSVPGLEHKPFVSGGLAGLAGVVATFVVIAGLGLVLKARRRAGREG